MVEVAVPWDVLAEEDDVGLEHPAALVAPRVPKRQVCVISELGVAVGPLLRMGARGSAAAIMPVVPVPGVGPAQQRLGRFSAVLPGLVRPKARVEGAERVLERTAVGLGTAVEADDLQHGRIVNRRILK